MALKDASTAPAFRLWTPTGETFPGVGASAVGFGKAMTDVDTKWFNKDAWRLESFLKRNSDNAIWVDPAAQKNAKGASVSATFGYDDMARKLKYRGKTEDSLKHTSELAYQLPLLDGQQRIKVELSTSLDNQTFLPKVDEKLVTKVYWKAMLPAFTTEAIVKQTAQGTDSVNAWIQGEVSKDIAYGGIVEYSVAKGALKLWEAGLLHTLRLGGGVFGVRAVTRNADDFELGLFPPARVVAGHKTQTYFKANHSLSKNNSDIAVSTEVKVCPAFDFKLRFAYEGLQNLSTAFSAIWSAPGGWRVAASLTNPGTAKQQFGLRVAQGSTPPPL